MNTPPATVVVLLTPVGRGAVATLLVEGPAAAVAVAAHFRSPVADNLDRVPIDKILYGRWGSPTGEEVVFCRRGETCFEIHSHGGRAAARSIIDDLVRSGCREELWTDWIARCEDRLSAAARVLLAHAPTERTAAILLDQYNGALTRELVEIRRQVMTADSTAAAQLRRLLQFAPVGLHLVEPFRVALAGPPNVGKSSLINALVGYQRSIVYAQPGTTRDVVTVPTALEGWPIELADTAGLRAGGDAVEQAGIEQAQAHLQQAHLVVLAFDQSQPWSAEQERILSRWPSTVVVHNKCDLRRGTLDDRPPGLSTSAVTGEGIADLAERIVGRLVPVTPPAGAAVPFQLEHVTAIAAALAAVERGEPAIAAELLVELIGPETPR